MFFFKYDLYVSGDIERIFLRSFHFKPTSNRRRLSIRLYFLYKLLQNFWLDEPISLILFSREITVSKSHKNVIKFSYVVFILIFTSLKKSHLIVQVCNMYIDNNFYSFLLSRIRENHFSIISLSCIYFTEHKTNLPTT